MMTIELPKIGISFRLTLFLFLFLMMGIANNVLSQNYSSQQKWLDTEGLYYSDARKNDQGQLAFVITRQGRTIQPKENDPEAPTKPGFYFGTQHYSFIKYSVTRTTVSFETVIIKGRSYRFRGIVRRGVICNIENVPELKGQLIEIEGARQKQIKVRFGHAVVC